MSQSKSSDVVYIVSFWDNITSSPTVVKAFYTRRQAEKYRDWVSAGDEDGYYYLEAIPVEEAWWGTAK